MNLPTAESALCVTCGAPVRADYCGKCGERRFDRSRLRFRSFAYSAFAELSDFEHSKVMKSLSALLFRPGVLTVEFLRGATKRYVGPLKLYLAVFGTSLFLYSIYQPAAIYDVRALIAQDRSGSWQKLVAGTAKKQGVSETAIISGINGNWQKFLSYSQLLYPAVLAGALSLLYRRAKRFYIEHLIFAAHVLAFSFLVAILIWPIYAVIGVSMWTKSFYVIIAALVVQLVYLMLASRRVYQERWGHTIAKGIILYAVYFALTGVIAVGCLGAALLVARASAS